MSLDQYKSLGVINRTPNSFSDKGASLNPDFFKAQLSSFLDDPTVIIDVGFESTAPMNQAISSAEEFLRFNDFLEASRPYSFAGRFISFDTYKPQNFLKMFEAFSSLHPQSSFIFNDVSGVLDHELKAVVSTFKGKDFYYIYNFTQIPDRQSVLDHMKHLNEKSDIIDQAEMAFIRAVEFFDELGMRDQLILDCGFGFSKTFEQNWRLINHYDELEKKLRSKEILNTHLIGLSKKSFLKKALGSDDLSKLEGLHLECLKKLRNSVKLPILFRVHDPKIIQTAIQ